VAECFLSPELGFHSHTRSLASRDGYDGCCCRFPAKARWWRLERLLVCCCVNDGGSSEVRCCGGCVTRVQGLMDELRFWFRCAQWWRTMVPALLAFLWCRFQRQGCVEVVRWGLRCYDVKVQIRGCCCDCSGESGGFSSPLVVAGADGAREVRCGEDGGGDTANWNQARSCGRRRLTVVLRLLRREWQREDADLRCCKVFRVFLQVRRW